MCLVHRCVSSSTSNRRKSDGWESSSTRETCVSNSWSWRLRTWKTPSLRAHFKICPAGRVTFTSSWDTCITFQLTNPILAPPCTLLHSFDSPLFFWWAPWTHCTGQGWSKPWLCVCSLSFCQFCTGCTYSLFMYIHGNTEFYPAATYFKTLCTFWPFPNFFCMLHSYAIKGCLCLSWLHDVALCELFESLIAWQEQTSCMIVMITLKLFSMLGDCVFCFFSLRKLLYVEMVEVYNNSVCAWMTISWSHLCSAIPSSCICFNFLLLLFFLYIWMTGKLVKDQSFSLQLLYKPIL